MIEPFADGLIQPSSIDVRVSNLFSVFRNHTAGIIDVKKDMTGLNELVEIPQDGVFMLHPGSLSLGQHLSALQYRMIWSRVLRVRVHSVALVS